MSNNPGQANTKRSKRIIQIAAPLLIILIAAVIFFVKNSDSAQTIEQSPNLTITELNIDEMTSQGKPVIIDFGSDLCQPCKLMAPELEAVHNAMNGKAFVHYVDTMESPEIAGQFPIQVVPTQVLYDKDGNPFVPSDELASQIQFSIYTHRDTGEHALTTHQGYLSAEQLYMILEEMGAETP